MQSDATPVSFHADGAAHKRGNTPKLELVDHSSTGALAKLTRAAVVKMCAEAGAPHVASALSVVDILAVLYGGVCRVSPATIDSHKRDVVILSKGHAAAALYAILAQRGFFPQALLDSYCSDGTLLGGHVTHGHVPGVEFSTGSLGHGLPFGAGISLSNKWQGLDSAVFVIVSDGECNEGSTWETALLASHHCLDQLTVLVDRNGLQSLAGTEETLALEPFAEKWLAFGWHVTEVDGHDHEQITIAIRTAQLVKSPAVVICNTTKGKGVSFMENEVIWHYRSPDEQELSDALMEIAGRADAQSIC